MVARSNLRSTGNTARLPDARGPAHAHANINQRRPPVPPRRRPAPKKNRDTLVLIYREHDSEACFQFKLPRLSLARTIAYCTAALGAILLALLIQMTVFYDAGGALQAGQNDAFRSRSLSVQGRRLFENMSQTRAGLERLNALHLAINERLFVGPDVAPAWYALPGLIAPDSNANASDSESRGPTVANLNQRLGALDQLFQQNKNYVHVYGEYLRGVPHRWPVAGGKRRINSGFGLRGNPFYGSGGDGPRKLHRGVDLKAAQGDLITAAAEGVVLEARRSGSGYGNRVRVFHPSGYVTLYAHLSAIYVKPEQYLKPGDRIGAAGSTGHSTGPHLHYEVHRDNQPIDPAEFIAED